MQHERRHCRKNGNHPRQGLFFTVPPPMNVEQIREVETLLRSSSQKLWDYRQKQPGTAEISTFLASSQDALEALLEHLAQCRQTLETFEPR